MADSLGFTGRARRASDDAMKLFETVSRLHRGRTAPLILEVDLTEGLADETPADPLGRILAMRRQRLSDVVEGIRRGAHDPRVKGLVAKIGGRPIGLARVQELRSAVQVFAGQGKPAVAWSESFGEAGPGTVAYYLASAFTEICLLPSGSVGLIGVTVGAPFFRDAVDKLGVSYEVGARHEYKTAVNTFTERGMTEAHREASGRVVESFTEQFATGIAEARGLDSAEVRALMDRGPFLASEARDAGLVDRLAYRDEVYTDLFDRFRTDRSGEPHLQYVARYHRLRSQTAGGGGRGGHVALVSAIGQVASGRSRRSPLGGSPTMGSETVAQALRAARRDPAVRSVVLRVDSPGGSYVASDVILREVRLTEQEGTPVVVSMGDVAASGGYFMALGAGTIVAQPGTITGSIGVFHVKAVLSGLFGKLGVATESVDGAAHAGMFGSDRRFTESEWERVNTLLDHIYDDFTGKVAEARGMSRAQVHEVARGRVWTGQDALAKGLVDELGGIATAVRIARERGGLPAGAPLRHYPRTGPLDRLVPAESSDDRTAASAGLRFGAWGPLADVSERLGLPSGGPLLLPGDWSVR